MKSIDILFNFLRIAISLSTSTLNTSAQSNSEINKVYIAKIYDHNKKEVEGILYSVDDSSIRLCTDTAFLTSDPLNDSLKIITRSYKDIERIKLIRKVRWEKDF